MELDQATRDRMTSVLHEIRRHSQEGEAWKIKMAEEIRRYDGEGEAWVLKIVKEICQIETETNWSLFRDGDEPPYFRYLEKIELKDEDPGAGQ